MYKQYMCMFWNTIVIYDLSSGGNSNYWWKVDKAKNFSWLVPSHNDPYLGWTDWLGGHLVTDSLTLEVSVLIDNRSVLPLGLFCSDWISVRNPLHLSVVRKIYLYCAELQCWMCSIQFVTYCDQIFILHIIWRLDENPTRIQSIGTFIRVIMFSAAMSELQATLEFAVELNRFYNVDLFQRGWVVSVAVQWNVFVN